MMFISCCVFLLLIFEIIVYGLLELISWFNSDKLACTKTILFITVVILITLLILYASVHIALARFILDIFILIFMLGVAIGFLYLIIDWFKK